MEKAFKKLKKSKIKLDNEINKLLKKFEKEHEVNLFVHKIGPRKIKTIVWVNINQLLKSSQRSIPDES